MKYFHSSLKIINAGIVTLMLLCSSHFVQAQACKQIEILYQEPDCYKATRDPNPAGGDRPGCKQINVCERQQYTYTASAGAWTSYNWSILSGPSIPAISPSNTVSSVNITWPVAGVYVLQLTVSDGTTTLTTCLEVTVKPKPTANFSFPSGTFCAGSNSVPFTNLSTPLLTSAYSWDFGDPTSGPGNYSNVTNPTHNFLTPGPHVVTLIAYTSVVVIIPPTAGTNGPKVDTISVVTCCADTIKKTIIITAGSIHIDCISTVCAGSKHTYTMVGCASPVWSAPVGATSYTTSGNQITIVWGNGAVQGQIIGNCPGGCTASAAVPIIPVTTVITGITNPCNTTISSYTTPLLPGTFYTWTLTDVTTNTNLSYLVSTYPDNNTANINWSLTPAGHTFSLQVSLNNKEICCKSTGTLTITPLQKFAIYAPSLVCPNTPMVANIGPTAFSTPTFAWATVTPGILGPDYTVSGAASGYNSATYIFITGNTYTLSATETTGKYCNTTASTTVVVPSMPAVGTISGPTAICIGGTFTYTMSPAAPAGFYYKWTIAGAGNLFMPGSISPSITGNSVNVQFATLTGATLTVQLVLAISPYCTKAAGGITSFTSVTSCSMPPVSPAVCVDNSDSYTATGVPLGTIVTWSISPAGLGTITSAPGVNPCTIKWHGGTGAGPWSATVIATTPCGTCSTSVSIKPKFTFTLTQTNNICTLPNGATITVTGLPAGTYTYTWPPPTVGGPASPTGTVNTPGVFSITANNGACSFTNSIKIIDPWKIKIAQGCKPYCVGNAIHDDLSVSVITSIPGTPTYQWYNGTVPTVGGLIPGATLANYTAPTYGDYCVEVKLGGCTKYATVNVEKICCPAIATISPITVVRSGCNSFTFTATTVNPSGYPTHWIIDGSTFPATSGVPFSYTYPAGTEAGFHCVLFHVGPPSPNPTSCTGNYSMTSVQTPIMALLDNNYIIGCNGCLTINNLSEVSPITGSAVINYTWDFGDATTPVSTGSSPIPPAHCYTIANPPGGFIVKVTLSYTDVVAGLPISCSESDVIDGNVFYTPININVAPVPVCTGQPVTFTGNVSGTILSANWTFGDTYQAFTTNTVHIYNAPNPSYPVVFNVLDNLGNTCTANTTVNVKPGISSCTIKPGYICPGSTATIGLVTALGAGYTYQWQVLSGVTMVNAPGVSTTATYTTSTAGFYQLIVTAPNGCTCTSNTAEVKNVPKPTVKFTVGPSQILCGGGFITTTAESFPGYNYTWSAYGSGATFGGNSFMAVYNVPAAITATTTNIHLVVTNEYGCKDSCIMPIVSQPLPVKPVITASSMCEGVPIILTVTNYASNVTWNNGAIGSTITVGGAGTYVATYTNPTTGCTSSKSITINRRPSTGLFPTLCDSIPCDTCVRPFAIYAPGPLVGALANIYNVAWYSGTIGSATPITTGLNTYNGLPNGVYNNLPSGVPTGTYFIVITDTYTGCKDTSHYYNVVVPPCDTCNCKGSHWGEIILNEGTEGTDKAGKVKDIRTDPMGRTTKPNGQDNGNPFPPKNAKAMAVVDGKNLECKGTYELACNKPYTISANWFCKDTICPSKVTYSLQPPTGAAITGTAPATFTPTLSGTYTLTLYGWCNNKICDSCIINFVVKCDCCKGSVWEQAPYYYFEQGGKPNPTKINCDQQPKVAVTGDLCKYPMVVGSKIKCGSADCRGADSVFVYDNANNIVLSGPAPLTIAVNSLPDGNYTVVLNGYCGGTLCLTCKFILDIHCKEKDCCKGSDWGQMGFAISNPKGSRPVLTKMVCGGNYKLECKKTYDFTAVYNCATQDCLGEVKYKLDGPGGPISSGTMPLIGFTPTLSGSYSLLLQGYCGGVLCKECKITFDVHCEVDTTCKPCEIKVEPKTPTYVVNPTSTTVSNSFVVTIPAGINVTEVRANVVSYTISDDYKGDCMKCVNLPFTWASVSTASNIATAPPKITMYGGTTVPFFNGSGAGAYQNPREIIWSNGTNLNSPTISNIDMGFILPPTPIIDCCDLKGKICVKFTFRDDQCTECEIIVCYNFLIKKK